MDERIPADGCSGNGGGDEGDDVYDQCEDTNRRADESIIGDRDGDPCSLYAINPHWCGGDYDTEEFFSGQMCCACGGGRDPNENDGEDGDGGDGGDDGNDQSVQALVEAALEAEATCSSQVEGSQELWNDILNNFNDLYAAMTKSIDELMKAEDARAAT